MKPLGKQKLASSILFLSIITGVLATMPMAIAQAPSISFSPQAQFPIGSSITIKSVYGLAGGPSPLTSPASLTAAAVVTNETANGDIIWSVKSGSIILNGTTTLTITRGNGGIGRQDRILMVGNATDASGHSYGWTLEGLAAVYSGIVIASLNGGTSYMPSPIASQQPPSGANRRPNGTPLNFIATVTA